MKILDDLMYQAGGYSADDLINAKATERRQIRQLGRASLFSILASMTSWGIASTLLVHNDNLLLVASTVFGTVLLTALVMFSLNRTVLYYSDVSSSTSSTVLLPLFRVSLIVLATTLCFFALAEIKAYSMVSPFILGAFEFYPFILKMNIGQTIAGHREQARMEHEHERSKLKKQEYAQRQLVEQTKINENAQTDGVSSPLCPHYAEPSPEKCQVQVKLDCIACIPCPNYENVRAMH